MSGVRMPHLLKDCRKFIQIHQCYTCTSYGFKERKNSVCTSRSSKRKAYLDKMKKNFFLALNDYLWMVFSYTQ